MVYIMRLKTHKDTAELAVCHELGSLVCCAGFVKHDRLAQVNISPE